MFGEETPLKSKEETRTPGEDTLSESQPAFHDRMLWCVCVCVCVCVWQ